jgi:hypothetical protein
MEPRHCTRGRRSTGVDIAPVGADTLRISLHRFIELAAYVILALSQEETGVTLTAVTNNLSQYAMPATTMNARASNAPAWMCQ